MSDIVERLLGPPTLFPEAREQASDEIERLRADHEKFATACMVKIGQLADDNAKLLAALDESIKLQSHYAKLLNMYDDGKRMIFQSSDEWLVRLDHLKARALAEQDKE